MTTVSIPGSSDILWQATIVPGGQEVMGGLRHDTSKPRPELIPPEALLALGKLYQVGSLKYDVRNWEKGMLWSKVLGPLFRHLYKWMMGGKYDPETGAHHLICVAWNAIALYTYAVRGLGENDVVTKGSEGAELWIQGSVEQEQKTEKNNGQS